jgi:3-dehydroquinate synthetase
MDIGFERVDHDIRDLRAEIASMRTTMVRIGGGIIVGLVGVIAAVLASGA